MLKEDYFGPSLNEKEEKPKKLAYRKKKTILQTIEFDIFPKLAYHLKKDYLHHKET